MRVLLVEDEVDIQKIVRLSLTLVGGHDVLVADNGAQALQMAGERQPDLILLDVMLPEMNGHQTLLELKQNERTQAIPVIFISAKTQRTEIEYGLSLGATGYIIKPFDPMQLPDQIQQILQSPEDQEPTPSGPSLRPTESGHSLSILPGRLKEDGYGTTTDPQ